MFSSIAEAMEFDPLLMVRIDISIGREQLQMLTKIICYIIIAFKRSRMLSYLSMVFKARSAKSIFIVPLLLQGAQFGLVRIIL